MKPIPEPIKIQIFGKHKNLGIDASKIDCSTVSLQSDKYVCFREQTDRFTHIYVVYGEKYSAVCRLKNLTSCEFAVMNPSLQLIAILDDENLESMKLSSMMLLYNVHQQKTEVYSAVTACFLHFKPNANAKPCTLLCFVGRDSFYGWMIHIENLSKHGCSFVKKAISFSFSQRRRDDFPVAMQANDKYGILFVITSHGYLHVFDVNDSICLYEGMFTSFPVVLLTAYKDSGIVCVNEMGCIVTAVIDEEEIISCLSISLKNKSAVMKFARRCNLPGAEGLFSWEFWDLCNNGEYYRAAELAAIIHMLCCSEQLGDMLKKYDNILAWSAYLRAGSYSKAIECLAEKYQLNSAALIGDKNCTKEDYISIFQQIVNNQKSQSVEASSKAKVSSCQLTFCLQLVEYPVTSTAKVDTEITAQFNFYILKKNMHLESKLILVQEIFETLVQMGTVIFQNYELEKL
ncbi:Clathrin heavy chain [Trichinella patagoniensis]|uniref:Clathrin heavy chain n=1 Tax=Trichinella patagoniensis TaxID=990121 RepID=A0A0V0ZJM9_9BILA|nr:Clathrin heavy chain [Trichinella patagoniensis]